MNVSSQARAYDPLRSVAFRKTKERYGGLSNMASGFPIVVNGIRIRTAEALYQACRYPTRPDVQRLIIEERSPMTAKMKAKRFTNDTRRDWDNVRVKIMRWCLRVKLAQNWDSFGTLLLSTGDASIVEDSRKDAFWGAKRTDDGELVGTNALGRLLMELREELKGTNYDHLRLVAPPEIPDFTLNGQSIGGISGSGNNASVGDERTRDGLTSTGTQTSMGWGNTIDGNIEFRGDRETGNNDMTTTRRKRLIEVAFPLEEVSAHSAHDKNVKQGHINMLHIWWARRPLAACRAFIYASLVDDPGTDAERETLLTEVADLASWDAVRHPDKVVRQKAGGGSGLTGTQLLERARQRILDDNEGKPPKLLDPFAGGGAIPLEGLRLGCEVEASDLNPVAVLILKGTLEYPQKYGQPDSRPVPGYIHQAAHDPAQAQFSDGDLIEAYRRNPLATDVRYWGHWMLEKAREELAEFYPPDPDGSVPVAYLWSRTIPCPSCHAEMPLIRQYWLARKDRKKVALEPVIDRENNRVDFRVVEGPDVTGDPAEATTSRGDTKCLMCGQVVKGVQVRQAGLEGKMSATLTSVVLASGDHQGKSYRKDTAVDWKGYQASCRALQLLQSKHQDDLPLVPDEPIDPKTLGLRVDAFGLDRWDKLFNGRQLLALTTFARLVGDAHAAMRECGVEEEYAKAVATYLGFALDRFVNTNSTLARLMSAGGRGIVGTFARQALSMVWDYAEANPFGSSASFDSAIHGVVEPLSGALASPFAWKIGGVKQRDARNQPETTVMVVVTDPPYYDAIDYAGLSDFFYVWLKRSVGFLNSDLLNLPLSPKNQQAIMASETGDLIERQRYVSIMADSFRAMSASLEPGGLTGVVFAHTDPDAWATLIEGLLGAGLIPDASWPIDTELQNKISAGNRANLKTSVWMACRKREEEPNDAFLSDVMEEMRPVIRERLLYFWGKGIRGADFFISAIGPALSVFGRHSRVLRPDGEIVSVRDFLDIVRRESTAVALEQVLQGADLGQVDPITRQYVTWVWSYSRAPLDSGEAIALCLATGAAYDEMTRTGSIAVEAREKSKKIVRLRTIRQRAMDDDDLGNGHAARPTPLIDQLQHAAWLWSQNVSNRLAAYRGQLGETRWSVMQTLGQAVAECLPDGDEDRRIVLGLLGSSIMAAVPRVDETATQPPMLPGFES